MNFCQTMIESNATRRVQRNHAIWKLPSVRSILHTQHATHANAAMGSQPNHNYVYREKYTKTCEYIMFACKQYPFMSGWRQRESLWRPDVYIDDFAPDLATTPCPYRTYTDLQWNRSFPEMQSFQHCSDVTETRYLTQDKFAWWCWHFGPRNMPI